MKFARKRLTYANVMSSIAVFLVVAGGSALAANQLGKNTVGSKQLKKNAVTGSKIKNHSVTGAKLNLSTIGTVPSATNAGHAASADTATTATNAANASNANATNGVHLGRLSYIAPNGSPETTIFNADGLVLHASCLGEQLEFTATTTVDHAEILASGNYNDTFSGNFNSDFDIGNTQKVGEEIGDNSQNEVQGQLVYFAPGGATVTASFGLEDAGLFNETATCAVLGTVQFS